MRAEWETCSRGHRCCEESDAGGMLHDHFLSAEDCTTCAAMADPLVASVEDECPTCGAYVLNPALHKDWHAAILRRAETYKPPPTYASAPAPAPPSGLTMRQVAPRPEALYELVGMATYRPGWTVALSDLDRGQGSEGLTLVITTKGYDSYHPDRGEHYRVHHYMPVPPAAYDWRSWRRWLFEQLLLVERHEACEFFQIGGDRPYAPHHGPGNDPYIVFELGTDEDVRTSFRGEVKP